MPLHAVPRPRRTGLIIATAAAVGALGVLAAALGLLPGTGTDTPTEQAAAVVAVAPAAPPPLLPALPALPAVATTTTTSTAPATTTTTTTRTTTRTPSVAVTRTAAAARGGATTDRVTTLVNAARADAGCAPVTRSAALEKAAADYAALMARTGTFSHTGPDGSAFSDRIRAAGYPDPGGENIARGQSSADEVMGDWMNSPGHRRNILDCSFRTIGVGHAADGDFWAQEFGR